MIPTVINYKILFLNLFFEILISYVNIISFSKNNHPVSSFVGKVKTTFLSITLILCYIPNINKAFVMTAALISVSLQVIALIQYKISDNIKDMVTKNS